MTISRVTRRDIGTKFLFKSIQSLVRTKEKRRMTYVKMRNQEPILVRMIEAVSNLT